MAKQKLPAFSELPLREGDPPFSAWGLYGKDDELGTLNRLTDEVVLEASKEIQSGVRISLNWPLDAQSSRPLFGREAFHSHLYQKGTRIVNDDVWTFNTQSSSQWDGLRHFGYQKEERFYNGVTLADIHAEDEHGNKTSTINGIGKWSEKGIVGRGVLLDFEAWRMTGQDGAEREYDAFSSDSAISLEELKKVAKAQGTTFRFGDILIVRSGFMAAYAKKSAEELRAHQETQPRSFGGVEQGEEVLEWLWENGFAAVAGDAPAFERWTSPTPYPLHEILLAGWGCPIGELFDLEALSAHCKATGRYSFFITSEVTNVPGGVASPPNILAIF